MYIINERTIRWTIKNWMLNIWIHLVHFHVRIFFFFFSEFDWLLFWQLICIHHVENTDHQLNCIFSVKKMKIHIDFFCEYLYGFILSNGSIPMKTNHILAHGSFVFVFVCTIQYIVHKHTHTLTGVCAFVHLLLLFLFILK